MSNLSSGQKKLIIQIVIGAILMISFVESVIANEFTIQQLAIYVGGFFGIILKVLIPFIRKLYEGKLDDFGIEFLWMMIATFLYDIPLFFENLNKLDFSGMAIGFAIFISFTIGLGTQWFTEELYRIGKNRKGQFTSLATILEILEGELTEIDEEPDNNSSDDPEPTIDPPIDTAEPENYVELEAKSVTEESDETEEKEPNSISELFSL